MKEFITQDGTHLQIREPSDMPMSEPRESKDYTCSCHKRMGNEFWFSPVGQCLRDDKTCDAKVPL